METFWAILKYTLLDKTAVDTFWATFRRTWATSYSAIWSHCIWTYIDIHLLQKNGKGTVKVNGKTDRI